MQIGLVGATNVGKSSLFNRLIGQFRAIVTEVHGTTQDILKHDYDHDILGHVVFADSPGLNTFDLEWPFLTQLMSESDIILFVIDAHVGFTAKESEIHRYIFQHGLQDKVILVVNKMDKHLLEDDYMIDLAEYYVHGYPNVVGVSAKGGQRIGMLRSQIEFVAHTLGLIAKDESYDATKRGRIPLAIVGRPNAGKSTLLNTLAHEELAKVAATPGTTLDYITADIEYEKGQYTLYDTAGIRKRSKTGGLEKIAYEKTISMLKYIRPIVVFLLDIQEGITHRDMTLLEEIHNKALPLLIAVNKTDTVTPEKYKKYVKDLAEHFTHARYIPIVPLSGIEGKGLGNMFKMVKAVFKESRKKVTTGELNKLIAREYISRPPRFPRNKICKILYMTQTDSNPPVFIVFINHKSRANFSFKRWLENVIRKEYGFVGVPLVFDWREREQKKHSQHGDSTEKLRQEYEEEYENDEQFAGDDVLEAEEFEDFEDDISDDEEYDTKKDQ